MVGGAVSLLSYSNFMGQELVNPTESKPAAACNERGRRTIWTTAFRQELAKVPVNTHMQSSKRKLVGGRGPIGRPRKGPITLAYTKAVFGLKLAELIVLKLQLTDRTSPSLASATSSLL